MLLTTYLVPSYFLAYFSFTIGDKMKAYFPIGTFANWSITTILSLIIVFLIILLEGVAIEKLAPKVSSLLKIINQMIQQF